MIGGASWQSAAKIDPLLRGNQLHADRLRKKRLYPVRYSRERCFSGIAQGRIALFRDCPVTLRRSVGSSIDEIATTVSTVFDDDEIANVRRGSSGYRRNMRVPDVMALWRRGRATFAITDLHVRGTRFYQLINHAPITRFNLLPGRNDLLSQLEMLTLVVSSKGNITDSHSDDPDGTNHCFIGSKLWLAWDRREGTAAGLQDVEWDAVYDRAAFDIGAFLRLRSSRWFVVDEGATVFLPGNFTHRVITLRPYFGISGFHLSIPGGLNAISRWLEDGGVNAGYRDTIEQAINRMNNVIKRLDTGSAASRKATGMDYLRASHLSWTARFNKTRRNRLRRKSAPLDSLVTEIQDRICLPGSLIE